MTGDRYLVGNQREQVSRFRVRTLFLVPLAAILFQVYIPRMVPHFFDFLGDLELPLLVTIYFALMQRSPIGGLFFGAAIGLVQDSLWVKQPLGMYGIAKTLVGYFAASVGLRIDVEHTAIRFLLTFFFYFFHQFLYWVLTRGLLGKPVGLDVQSTLVLGLLNAVVGVTLFHFLDRLKEPA